MADNDENDLSTIVAHLTSSSMGGLNFIALDFDQTILEVHTGGFWEGTLEELVHHVRPEMRQLLPALVYSTNDNTNDKQNRTLHVAVVTFSSQPDMVRNVIQSVLTTCTTTENDLANNNSHDVVIPIRGEDGSWKTPNPIHRGERWWGTEAATTTTAVAANATFCRSDNSCWELNPDDDDDDDNTKPTKEDPTRSNCPDQMRFGIAGRFGSSGCPGATTAFRYATAGNRFLARITRQRTSRRRIQQHSTKSVPSSSSQRRDFGVAKRIGRIGRAK